ncbi:MAG: hypothetical protein ACKVS6_11840 [Planctomycetota bacterium]
MNIPFLTPARAPDVSAVFAGGQVHLAFRTRDGAVRSTTIPAIATDIEAAIIKFQPASKRVLLAFLHADTTTETLPAPPGIERGADAWLESITKGTAEAGAFSSGVWFIGARDRLLAYTFSVSRPLIDLQISILHAAKLKPVAAVPAILAAPYLAIARGAENALVVDLLDSASLTFTALAGRRALVVRTLSRSALPTTQQIVEEARRTMSYVRERHRGLTLDEIYDFGADPELRNALLAEGLKQIESAGVVDIASACLHIHSDMIERGSLSRVDLLPTEHRYRSSRRLAFISLGGAAAAAAVSLGYITQQTQILEKSLRETTEQLAQADGSNPELDRRTKELYTLRETAARLGVIRNEAKTGGSSLCIDRLLDILQSPPEFIQFDEFLCDGSNLIMKGYTVSERSGLRTRIEQYALDVAKQTNANFPILDVTPAIESPGDLGGEYKTKEWVAERFSLQLKWN